MSLLSVKVDFDPKISLFLSFLTLILLLNKEKIAKIDDFQIPKDILIDCFTQKLFCRFFLWIKSKILVGSFFDLGSGFWEISISSFWNFQNGQFSINSQKKKFLKRNHHQGCTICQEFVRIQKILQTEIINHISF